MPVRESTLNQGSPETARLADGLLERLVAGVEELSERRLAQLVAGRRFQQSEDPVEAVHDLRVASRRLRAVAETFGPVLGRRRRHALAAPLKEVTRAVGRLREYDVLQEHLARQVHGAEDPVLRSALHDLCQRLARRRQRERRRALRALAGFDERRVARALSRATERLRRRCASLDTAALVERALGPRFRELERSLPRGPDDHEGLHRGRIAAKRLRYALELLEPTIPALRAARREVTCAQDLLGEHHDLWVLLQCTRRHRRRLARQGRGAEARAMGPLLRTLEATLDGLAVSGHAALVELPSAALREQVRESVARAPALPLSH